MSTAERFHFKLKRFALILLMFGGMLGSFYNFADIVDPTTPIESLGAATIRALFLFLIAIVAVVAHHRIARDYFESHPEDRERSL